MQQTSLRVITQSVPEKVEQLKNALAQTDGALRSSTFSRQPDGQGVANLTLCVPMKMLPWSQPSRSWARPKT